MPPNFLYHLHPPTIPAAQSRWRYTLGAGGTAVFLLLVIAITGMLELFYYVPTTTQAATSIQTLTYLVPFGGLVRNLHFWSAQLLMVVLGLHLARVIFTGAYTPPRRFNYLLGLTLLVLAGLLDFSGYVLRWDQGIQWALVVGTNLVSSVPWVGESLYPLLVGGTLLGQATLTRFYAWHLFGLSLPAAVLVAWHLFRLRRDGGLAVPPPGLRVDRTRITRTELVQREVLAMVLTAAGLVLVSIVFPAPIAAPIGETAALPAEAHAPWFFLWVQQMLKWGDPLFWGVLVPTIALLLLALTPYLYAPPEAGELGRWFPASARGAQIGAGILFALILALTWMGAAS